jgi:hypothetical protein
VNEWKILKLRVRAVVKRGDVERRKSPMSRKARDMGHPTLIADPPRPGAPNP